MSSALTNSVGFNSCTISNHPVKEVESKLEQINWTPWKGSQATSSPISARLSVDEWEIALDTQKKTRGFFNFSCEVSLPLIDWNARRPSSAPIWDDRFWLLEEMDLPNDWQKLNAFQIQVYLAAVLRNNKLSAEEFDLIKTLSEVDVKALNPKQTKLYTQACQILDLNKTHLFLHAMRTKAWEMMRIERQFEWDELKLGTIDWKARHAKIKTEGSAVWKEVVDYLTPKKIRERVALPTLYLSHFVLNQKEIPAPELKFVDGCDALSFPQSWFVKIGNYFLLEREDLPQGWQDFSGFRLQFYLASLLRNRKLSVEEFELLKDLESMKRGAELTKKQLELYNQIDRVIPHGYTIVFGQLMARGEWENARKAIFAHEFAHMTGSYQPGLENMHLNRVFEKEADMIACLVCDGSYAKAHHLTFKLHAKYVTEETESVDISAQGEDEMHPSNKTRAEYTLAFISQ